MSAVITDNTKTFSQIRASDIPFVLDQYKDKIKVLSLDCFDTLIWRNTATPKDVFYELEQGELFKSLGITAHQRINAAARAYRKKNITHGNHQIKLHDIYRYFTSLTPEQQQALAEEELQTEIKMCYAFTPFVDLIRKAKSLGLSVIIVSDIYLTETQLRKLLSHTLPQDAYTAIDAVFCSTEYETAKSHNLFQVVLQKLNLAANAFLHIGDHPKADAEAPRKLGLHALHFLQFDTKTIDILRLQHSVSALTTLTKPITHSKYSSRYSPFRGVFASTQYNAEKPETSIGYMTFGPILYTFAKFVFEEIETLRQSGKKPKVFFLLRDAYLLSKACETYAGEPLGKLVRIRKFVTVAASFRTQADVDHYISSITPQYFNFWVICEQLLLPKELTQQIITAANSSPQPEQTFFQLIHQQNILDLIFANSAAYRARLIRYMHKEMQINDGDTIVLVDTGYAGVTQEFLTRALQNEVNVNILGLYFIASHEPDRPNCKSLMTSTWCEHGLFEQSCTYKEGCVLDYDNDGNPIFDNIKLSDEQYNKVSALQTEALRFIQHARAFFQVANKEPSLEVLREYAIAALQRNIFFPLASEIHYFQTFQHDKDMGHDGKKTMYHIENNLHALRQNNTTPLHPYASRSAGLDHTLSSLLRRGYDLDISIEPKNYRTENINLVMINGSQATQITVPATYTDDGYYSFCTPSIKGEQIGILFGEKYLWLQIDSIQLLGNFANTTVNTQNNLFLDQMTNKNGNLFECLSDRSLLILTPLAVPTAYAYQLVFRPIVKR